VKEYLFRIDVSAEAESEEEAEKQICKEYGVSVDQLTFVGVD